MVTKKFEWHSKILKYGITSSSHQIMLGNTTLLLPKSIQDPFFKLYATKYITIKTYHTIFPKLNYSSKKIREHESIIFFIIPNSRTAMLSLHNIFFPLRFLYNQSFYKTFKKFIMNKASIHEKLKHSHQRS